MGIAKDDVLAWLCPGVAKAEASKARRLVTFLRLLRDDARGLSAENVGVDLMAARRELERGNSKRRLGALGDLLRYYLQAALPRDSYVCFGQPRISFQRAWAEVKGLELPGPGALALEVAAQLIEHAQQCGAGALWLGVWRARLVHVRLGFEGARSAWRSLDRRARQSGDDSLRRVAWWSLFQGSLDRRDLAGANRLLKQAAAWITPGVEWQRACLWMAVLRGDLEGARRQPIPEMARALPLPLPLAELRERVPAWGIFLSGVPRQVGLEPELGAIEERATFGASVMGILRPKHAGAMAEAVHWDAGNQKQRECGAFLKRRQGTWKRVGEPEHQALAQGRMVFIHAVPGNRPCAMQGSQSCALVLVPLLDRGAIPFAWIHLEFSHHCLPSVARLEVLGKAWALRLSPSERQLARHPRPALSGELARVAGKLLKDLPISVSGRRAVLFDWDSSGDSGDQLRQAANLGSGLGEFEPHVGPLVLQVGRSGAPVVFGRGPGRGAFLQANSGVLAPLIEGGRVRAILAVEAQRPGQFAALELDKLALYGARSCGRWRAAKFSAWHAEQYGESALSPLGSAWWQALGWDAMLGARQPLSILGEAHNGKLTLARWVHFEGRGAERPFVALGFDGEGCTSRKLHGAWERAKGGTLCVNSPAGLARPLRDELGRRIKRSAADDVRDSVRVVAIQPSALGVPAIGSGLGHQLKSLEVCVPGLRDRRDQILPLADCMIASQSRHEGLDAIQLNDAARALLWRQPWPGNVGELKAVLMGLSVLHPGEGIGPQQLQRVAKLFGEPLCLRLPSLNPRALDIQSALDQTRCSTGRLNKTRAGLYLGWDPDTLVRRMVLCSN